MSAPVWLVASTPTTRRWAEAFADAGLDALALPWSEPSPVGDAAALARRLDARAPVLVLLTSPNAPGALPAGFGQGRVAACVGEATAAAARGAGFDVRHVGLAGGAGLARALLAAGTSERVVFLRGREARREGVEILEAAGVDVVEEIVYEARKIQDFADRVAAAPAPAGVAVGSPRGAEALEEALRAADRAAVRAGPVLAVGATTEARLVALGYPRVLVPDVPGAAGLVARARVILGKRASPGRARPVE